MLTTNRGVASWGEVLGDTTVAAAMLDRLLHRCVVLNLDGDLARARQPVYPCSYGVALQYTFARLAPLGPDGAAGLVEAGLGVTDPGGMGLIGPPGRHLGSRPARRRTGQS